MKFEFSAGGVVVKKVGDQVSILVAQHSQHHGWVFPKGLIGDTKENESKEETAVREVQEETGVDAKIVQPLRPVTYWYQLEGQKIKKTVYYYLMDFVSGDIKKHDDEMENVEWLPPEKIDNRLTYESDKKVWKQVKTILAKTPKGVLRGET